MLEKQGRRLGVNVQKAQKEGTLLLAAQELNFSSVDDLVSAVGYARVTPRRVLNFFLPKPEEQTSQTEEASPAARPTPEPQPNKANSIIIKGIDDILVRFAKCCNPVPGDPIIGYISRGRGVAVHTASCPTISQMEPERLISVYWEGSGESQPVPARIHILCKNERGMLAKISSALETGGVNIDSGTFRSHLDGRSEMEMVIEVADIAELLFILDKLRKVPNVFEVSRVTSAENF
jgi:GTP pyrophosphokinase